MYFLSSRCKDIRTYYVIVLLTSNTLGPMHYLYHTMIFHEISYDLDIVVLSIVYLYYLPSILCNLCVLQMCFNVCLAIHDHSFCVKSRPIYTALSPYLPPLGVLWHCVMAWHRGIITPSNREFANTHPIEWNHSKWSDCVCYNFLA